MTLPHRFYEPMPTVEHYEALSAATAMPGPDCVLT